MADKTATFVLVHGAWGGSYGWTPLAEEMRRRGHRVFTPSLTGLGERTHLAHAGVNLSLHIEDVCNVVKYERLSDFVLVGHSYGGMVVTGVADRLAGKIRSLVYVDAFLPENGKSLFDYTPNDNNGRLNDSGANHGGFFMSSPPQSLVGLTEEEKALRSPQPLATCLEKIKLTGAGDSIKNKMYVFAANYSPTPFRQFYDRVRSQPGWKTSEVNCGHGVHREKPQELIALLESMI